MKALNADNAEQKLLLDLLNSKGYVTANDDDYGKLREAANSAGFLH